MEQDLDNLGSALYVQRIPSALYGVLDAEIQEKNPVCWF